MVTLQSKKIVFLACALLLMASTASAIPADHAVLMKDSEYKEAFAMYSETLHEAEKRMQAQDLSKVKNDVQAQMEASVKEYVSSGLAEAEAWATAFILGKEELDHEMTRDWLCRHPEGMQGFYRMQSSIFDGWLAIQKADAPEQYAVHIFAIQKNEPFNSGELEGLGTAKGNVISAADKNDDENPVSITVSGETATISEPKAFKESGALGAGVSFEGSYLREKK